MQIATSMLQSRCPPPVNASQSMHEPQSPFHKTRKLSVESSRLATTGNKKKFDRVVKEEKEPAELPAPWLRKTQYPADPGSLPLETTSRLEAASAVRISASCALE